MSGAQTSTFGNVLFNAPAAYQAAQTYKDNQLLMQQHQQTLASGETEMAARMAGTLLSLPTPEARAAAWPGMLASARANGWKLANSPDTYPGDDTVQMVARLGTPSKDLLAQGQAGAAASDFGTRWGTQPPATGGGTTAAAPTSTGTVEPDALARAQAIRDGLIKRGLDVDTATGFAANALHESGANPNVGTGDAGASHGAFQWRDDRYTRFNSITGRPLDNAPLDQQLDYVIHELNTTEGAARDRINAAQGPAAKAAAISQFYLRPKDVEAEKARRSGTAMQLVSQWGSAGTSTANATIAPVIAGDSLASQGGLGGTGVVGASPRAVLASVQADSRAGKYSGQPVVLSTGASNDPTDLASVEQQIREAQGGNAGKITVLGVGPAVEAKAPGTNAELQALAKSYGADFVPLPADQMSPDGVHPTAQGYAALKAAIAPPQDAPGGGGAPGRYQVAGAMQPPPGSAVAAPSAMPRDQAVEQAQRTGQPVPVAGTQGLWALPNGNLTSTPPAPAAAQPAAQSAQQQPPAPSQQPLPSVAQPTIPPPPRTVANDLTAEQLAEIPVLKRQVQLGQITAAEADKVLLGYQTANRAAQRQYALDVQGQQEKAKADAIAAETQRLAQEKAKRETEQFNRPFQGTGMDPQWQNILDKGDDGSAQYARAYTAAAAPKYNPQDGSWVKPNMTAYDKPTYIPKGMTEPPDYSKQEIPTPTILNATQSQAAGFADRVRDALPVITDTSDAAMSRWQILLGKAPLGNSWVSPEFQQHVQAERNFINATLRRESGMAISESEFVNARQQYIPQPGDGEKVLAQKQRNREQILATLTREAGPAYKPAPPANTAPAADKPLSNTKIKVDASGNIIQ